MKVKTYLELRVRHRHSRCSGLSSLTLAQHFHSTFYVWTSNALPRGSVGKGLDLMSKHH